GRITTAGVLSHDGGLTSDGLAIAAGADGRLWFTESISDPVGRVTIGRMATDGTVALTQGNGIDGAQSLLAGPDGDLWFGNGGASPSIGRVSPAGTIRKIVDPGINDPEDLIVGPDHAVWFIGGRDGSIGRVTTAGVVTNFGSPGSFTTG